MIFFVKKKTAAILIAPWQLGWPMDQTLGQEQRVCKNRFQPCVCTAVHVRMMGEEM